MVFENTTSEDTIQNSKDVRIREITLHVKAGEISLYNFFQEIQLFEDIFTQTMSGTISLMESHNLPQLAEITGGEKLVISYKTAGQSSFVELEFYIYKISERMLVKDRTAIYTYHFTTKEMIANALVKISRSLSGTVTDMVNEIFSSPTYGLGSEKTLTSEQSINQHKFIIPYWSPLRTITWLSKKAVSGVFRGSPFVFFENKRGFQFFSLENLYSRPSVKTYMYAPRLVYGGIKDPVGDSSKVESYVIKSSMDMLKSLSTGGYASRLITYDILTKIYQPYDYDHVTDVNQAGELVGPRFSPIEKNKVFNKIPITQAYTAHMKMHHKHLDNMTYPNGSGFGENSNVEMWSVQGDSYLSKLNTICLELEVSGDSSINTGDVITFNVPSYAATDNANKQLDKYLSGRYLITAIAHYIRQDSYSMTMEICKDSISEPLTAIPNDNV